MMLESTKAFSISNIIGVVVGIIVLVAVNKYMLPPIDESQYENIPEKNWNPETGIRAEGLDYLNQAQRIGVEKIKYSQETGTSFKGRKDMLSLSETNDKMSWIKSHDDNKYEQFLSQLTQLQHKTLLLVQRTQLSLVTLTL